jgi:hypothetical protein
MAQISEIFKSPNSTAPLRRLCSFRLISKLGLEHFSFTANRVEPF